MGNLGGEDALIGAHSSMQGPFPLHAREDAVVRPREAGQTVGPSLGPVGADGSAAAPGVLVEGGGSTTVPHELIGVDGFVAVPEVLTERDGSTVVPSEAREMSPLAREQGAGSK